MALEFNGKAIKLFKFTNVNSKYRSASPEEMRCLIQVVEYLMLKLN